MKLSKTLRHDLRVCAELCKSADAGRVIDAANWLAVIADKVRAEAQAAAREAAAAADEARCAAMIGDLVRREAEA